MKDPLNTGGVGVTNGRRLLAFGLAVLGVVSTGLAGGGGARETVPLAAWEFTPDLAPKGAAPIPPTQAQWRPVTIPHIFRQAGMPDNAAGWYLQTVATTEADRGRRVFLVLEGAASVKDVFVNGRHIGQHKSAYTAAAFDLTPALELTVNGASQGWMKNGEYRIPDVTMKKGKGGETLIRGIRVDNVFFWKAKLAPGRNVVEVSDGAGHRDRMVVYQRPADGPMPSDPKAIVQDLSSSNPASPALFVDRPVEAQAPFYTDVDGSSDNTFDVLPAAVNGASWIGTRRLGDRKWKTDLSFRINPGSEGATVFVVFSTGTFPVVTLKKQDQDIEKTAAAFTKALAAAGFVDSGEKAVWRDHNLERADAALWSRDVKAGEKVTIPGQTFDYVVMAKGFGTCQFQSSLSETVHQKTNIESR